MLIKFSFPRMFTNLGVRADDPEDLRLKKNLLVASRLLISVLALLWGMLYLSFGKPLAASIPISYAVLSFISVTLFSLTAKYRLFHLSQLLLTLMLPFFLAMTLGGFINSSAVLLWSLTCPIGAFLFADMSGFTRLSALFPPVEIVQLLNEYFSYFDSLCDRHGVEKIRTIGDNYMAACGIPRPKPDHAERLARMALEMRDYIKSHPSFKDNRIRFRIGINSGVVVAGVVGLQKFHYDVWGDAVNFASRMESHGVPGKIQISHNTYNLIQENFRCRRRGTVTLVEC